MLVYTRAACVLGLLGFGRLVSCDRTVQDFSANRALQSARTPRDQPVTGSPRPSPHLIVVSELGNNLVVDEVHIDLAGVPG